MKLQGGKFGVRLVPLTAEEDEANKRMSAQEDGPGEKTIDEKIIEVLDADTTEKKQRLRGKYERRASRRRSGDIPALRSE